MQREFFPCESFFFMMTCMCIHSRVLPDGGVEFCVLKKYFLYDEKRRRAFLRELRTLSQVVHPNVIQVIGFFIDGDCPYVVLPSEGRQTLHEWMQLPRTELEICDVMHGLLSALEGIHSRGITHSDVKPHNIMIRSDGTPVLIDFDVSRKSDGMFATQTQS